MAKVQKTYTREFKEEAVRLAQTSGKSITQVDTVGEPARTACSRGAQQAERSCLDTRESVLLFASATPAQGDGDASLLGQSNTLLFGRIGHLDCV